MSSSQQKVPLPDLKGQNLMQFADINSDMFTDIITVDKSRQNVVIHIFDAVSSNYSQKVSFQPTDCYVVTNVAVGRSANTLRLFVTCQDVARKTILRMYDRNMDDELTATANTTSRDKNSKKNGASDKASASKDKENDSAQDG